jgi:type II restriction/modification system DNA methylase subunit YeeA
MSNDSTKTSDNAERHFYRASAADFKKIPGSPIAYWVSENFLTTFNNHKCIQDVASLKAGMSTGDNPTFQRYWYEVDLEKTQFDCIGNDHSLNNVRWFPCNSGGQFRKWYGNNETVVDWENNGQRIKSHRSSAVRNVDYYFKSGLTYSKISSGRFAARQKLTGFLFDDTGRSISAEDNKDTLVVLALLCSEVAHQYLAVLAPSMSFTSAEIGKIPFLEVVPTSINENSKTAVEISKQDWNTYETSWDFTELPLLSGQPVGRVSDSVTRQPEAADVGLRYANPTYPLPLSIKETYTQLRAHWREMTLEMQRLEQEIIASSSMPMAYRMS